MEISEEGFRTRTGTNGVVDLLFDSERAEECCEFAISNNLKIIALHPICYKAKDLKPILKIRDFIEGLYIGDQISHPELNTFTNLILLSVQDNKKDIVDLSDFPNLETLSCNFTKRLKNLDSAFKLKSLSIGYYKSNTNDLTDFPELTNLEYLFLVSPRIKSLLGIDKLFSIKELEIFGTSTLESIGDISKLSSLELLEISNCKNIGDYENIQNLPKLKKIILGNSGVIKNLKFIKTLPSLETFTFVGTNVLDGDLSYCIGLKNVGFINKRHYSHKSEDFKKKV